MSVVVVVAAATMAALLAPQSGASAPAAGAFTALSGSAASGYTVPADMKLVRRLAIGGGTYERYQQVYGAAGRTCSAVSAASTGAPPVPRGRSSARTTPRSRRRTR